ncbi:MAG: DinB family protein [Anaerolineales bacterium]|nr:DinB family protein [Anaerolineales bacterium]
MTHPLVDQLRFTRREFLRGINNLTDIQAERHFGQMNCISWIIGHLAWHEQRMFLTRAQDIILIPELNELFAYGAPMSTPSFIEMMLAWNTITKAADPYLDSITTETLLMDLPNNGRSVGQMRGTSLRRITYHYWYHLGEIMSIRQMIGGEHLPDFVGNIDSEAPYRPE